MRQIEQIGTGWGTRVMFVGLYFTLHTPHFTLETLHFKL